MLFLNIGGNHTAEDGSTVPTGEKCESDKDLVTMFPNHFQRLPDPPPQEKNKFVAQTAPDDEDDGETDDADGPEDVTEEYAGAKEAGLVIQKLESTSSSGKPVTRFNVYDVDDMSVTVNDKPLTAKKLGEYLAENVTVPETEE